MAISTQRMMKKTFDSPDETRGAGSGKAQIVNFDDLGIMKMTLPPGWKWSKDVQPIAKTDSCQAPHVNYILSGRIHVRMNDGTENELGPGDVSAIPPGHDAWVVGDETLVALDVTGSGVWAKPS